MAPPLDLFVDAATLAAHLDDAAVQVVAVDGPGEFAQAHIPGALRLAMPDFVAAEPPVAGLLPEPAALSATLTAAGLRSDAHIVAYDRTGDAQAARLLYTLDAMGHGGLSLLDGGLAAWHGAGLALAAGAAEPGAGDFRARPDPARIADRAWIASHLEASDTLLVDTRSAAEFAGVDVRSARGGHIPGAVHLDWQALKDDAGRLRPAAELEAILAAHGIERERNVTLYCQSHTRSSHTYWVLKWLGFERLRGYPGAWSDWGNAERTPVAQRDPT